MDRHRDPKHNRRATERTREESYEKNQSAQQLEEEEDFIHDTRSSFGSSIGIPTNHTTRT
jgi:hypothetical protein